MDAMSARRRRPLWVAATALIALWVVVGTAFYLARQAKMTSEKVLAYMHTTDLARMSPAERRAALQELARRLNELPPEDRRDVRLGGPWERWFNDLTEQEKADFIEATMPAGFKQMLASFEKLPEEKRRKTVEDALRDLRRAREAMADGAIPAESGTAETASGQTNSTPILSAELQKKIVGIGLNAFYSESSAQTKAELAPVLEEMQRTMQSGGLFRRIRE
jgi:hypothetical protein